MSRGDVSHRRPMSRGDGVTALLALVSRLGRCAVLRSCAQMVRS